MSRRERRSQPRFRLDRMVVRTGNVRARAIDLSLDGMSLRSERPLTPGRTYPLQLGDRGPGCRLLATVVWCSVERIEHRGAEESVPIYRAGLELRPPSTDERGGGATQPVEPAGPSSPRSTSRWLA